MKKLPEFRIKIFPKNNRIHVVYFLFDNDDLVYVGQSNNYLSRISDHLKDKKFNSYSFIQVNESKINETETYFILKYKPKYNTPLRISNGYGYTTKYAIAFRLKITVTELNDIISLYPINDGSDFHGITYYKAKTALEWEKKHGDDIKYSKELKKHLNKSAHRDFYFKEDVTRKIINF